MTRAVIFDMFETLITHYNSPLYFGKQMAADAGIKEEEFQAIWRLTEEDRTVGRLTFEDTIINILTKYNRYSDDVLNKIVEKRIAAKKECFKQLHSEIVPMLAYLKDNGMLVGLISNCFSEEAKVIRESLLFPYFDAVYLSYEQGIQKPDAEIFTRCIKELSVKPEECIYVGDGGSQELEASRSLGMKAMQAAWYLKEGTFQPVQRKDGFLQLDSPFDIKKILK